MHVDRVLIEGRIERILDQRLRPAVYSAAVPLELTAWHVRDEPVPVSEALAASYAPFHVGDAWGAPWSTSWIRAVGTVPPAWAGRRVEALFDLGFAGDWPGFQAEALAYDAGGHALKGIEPRNQYVPVADPAAGGEQVELLLEAAANPVILAGMRPTPLGDKSTATAEPLYRMARADLAVLDEDVWHLTLDVEVLDQLMRQLSQSDPRRHEILRALERAMNTLDIADVSATAAGARAALAHVMASGANRSAHTITAVGHAHIDSAWLWPLRETKRKTSRTFSNVTALAAAYPEFVFACSQAQQYDWVKRDYPEIFQRIRSAVKAGQWAPVGGMWVEADGNLPGGEALARQLIVGKRFFLDEFGVECQGVWLPDSFGYTAAYPQLARLAGMRWFLTQKLSWNQTNRLPHHTFWWEGIDGSRVFTHFPPVDTYNSSLSGEEMARAVRNYAEKGKGTRSLAPFGYGDGGGGPTREMVERARRLHDLEGSPRVVIEDPDTFFKAAQEEYPDAPVWSGELYLELHRGTFTSQARTKAGNRRSEHLLREAELWATAATVQSGRDYPYETLDQLWKTVLLQQFHDILPGSSIAWVHREAEATYAQVKSALDTVITDAIAAIAGRGAEGAGSLWVFNTSPRDRAEVATVPEALSSAAPSGAQRLSDGGVAVFAQVAGSGAALLMPSQRGPVPAPVTVRDSRADGRVLLDNGLTRVHLDGAGLLASVRDLIADREVLAPEGKGNLLRLHTDFPNDWDAWDIDSHYRDRYVDLTEVDAVTIVDGGPLVGSVRIERTFSCSRIVQTVRLRAGSRRVDIDTEVDWREAEKLLKASFPLDVHADRSAAEIQFGHVFRPTHTNTSWDAARFEVYCHRWVHVGEPGYGVALLNDATYGHDVTRDGRADGGTTTTARLSLLRAPRFPDPAADQGRHRMTYSLLPGASIAEAVAEGYALNLPVRFALGCAGPEPASLVSVDGAAACVEAVKLADDRSGDVVVRLYEALGGRAATTLRVGFPVAAAAVVDLLERPYDAGGLTVSADGRIPIALRPFQVLTVRLQRL